MELLVFCSSVINGANKGETMDWIILVIIIYLLIGFLLGLGGRRGGQYVGTTNLDLYVLFLWLPMLLRHWWDMLTK